MGDVGWEPHGSSPTTCAGKADHGFVVYVPLALICLLKIVNLTVLLHKEFEIPTLRSKFFEILKFVFFSEVAHKSFCVKFSGLIRKLKSLKNHIKVRKYATYRLIFGLFLKLKKIMVRQ